MARQIIAMGGGVLAPDTGNFKLETYILNASGAARPRICYVATASGDDPAHIARFYEAYGRFDARLGTLPFFRRTPADLRAALFEFDVVHVGGGNTRSMLAVWRDWSFDVVLREAYERGILLCGSSAGAICWFETGVTDSIAGDLTPVNCLGFLAGSNCPHYDGEKDRRPSYQRMVREGRIASGFACDDGVGLHFVDEKLARIPSARENARAYRVERTPDGVRETPLDVLQL
jgi:dipeptidase E